MFPNETELFKALPETQVKQYGPLTLAFVGDAVYSLLIRSFLTEDISKPAGKLHKESVKYVNASFQAECARLLLDKMNDDEMSIFKRGRNAHSAHSPKNQSSADYRHATGLEALFGYLYMCASFDRLNYFFNEIKDQIHAERNNNGTD